MQNRNGVSELYFMWPFRHFGKKYEGYAESLIRLIRLQSHFARFQFRGRCCGI
jgi:hypothetical protein